jgi:F0F1-type ATP synthase membrane subunit c/vacuolar-type H+-ATPase subunit K
LDTYVAPTPRTVKLRAAVAVGAALVAGSFGMGYVFSEALDGPTPATNSASRAISNHALSHALAESLVLKNRTAVEGKAADIRYRRVIAP